MFEIVDTVKGGKMVVTDNPSIAASIRAETGLTIDESSPGVFFTGAPDRATAVELSRSLQQLTGRDTMASPRTTTPMGYLPWTVIMGKGAKDIQSPRFCPVEFYEILRAEFRPMEDEDYYMFSGVNGTGYVAEIGECLVVYDDDPDGNTPNYSLQVHHTSGKSWELKISKEYIQLT